ncbi:MAG: hypothetical protein A4E54_00116 [Pelotomaculum sp. PtaB.Bin117]|nr:MAG: hypothetical protein A4E54_00116 [Pelotomaculum sp. PtaB.Bin117]
MEKGRLAAYGDTEEVLRQKGFQNLPGVMLPDYLQLIYTLAGRGQNVNPGIVTLAEAELEIAKLLEEKNK